MCSKPSVSFSCEGGVLSVSWVVSTGFSAVEEQLGVLSTVSTAEASIPGLSTLMQSKILAFSVSTFFKHLEIREKEGKQ